MSDSDDTVETAYGRLDRAALLQAQQTYDTTSLLRMVDDLDAMLSEAPVKMGCAICCCACTGWRTLSSTARG